MANTYTQLYFHIVFAVKGRTNFISKNWEESLYKYVNGIVSNKNQKLMVIKGVPNHVHLLIGLKPDCSISDIVRDIKCNSTNWINKNKFVSGKFEWQNGFGAFSVSQTGIDAVVNYILNQEEHHKNITFRAEYINFLNANKIDFKSEYIFDDDTLPPDAANSDAMC